MTAPRFRRHRNPDGRRPAFTGDFPPDSRDITEVLEHVQAPDWDSTTVTLTGLRGQPRYTPRATPGPDMFPALPTAPPPPPPAAAQHDPRDTGPQQRLPRYARTAARPRPRRDPDDAIFVWVPSISQHVLLCGMCRWRRHADPITATMPFTFESLRQSAYITGWRLDAFTRWCCPACQGTAAYRSPRPVTHPHPELRALHAAGQPADEKTARAIADSIRGRVVPLDDGTSRDAEAWFRGVAERNLIRDVADAAGHGRHRAATR